jgi:hypothetical protein
VLATAAHTHPVLAMAAHARARAATRTHLDQDGGGPTRCSQVGARLHAAYGSLSGVRPLTSRAPPAKASEHGKRRERERSLMGLGGTVNVRMARALRRRAKRPADATTTVV